MNKYEVVKRLLNLKERIDTFFLRIMEFLGYKYVCSNWQGMDNEYTLYWEVYVYIKGVLPTSKLPCREL